MENWQSIIVLLVSIAISVVLEVVIYIMVSAFLRGALDEVERKSKDKEKEP